VDPHRGARLIVPQLVTGLIIGTILSGIVWFIGFATMANELLSVMLVTLLGIKYVGGLTLLFFRDWRMIGVGIFVSVPIGAVIFFSACAMNIK